MRGEYAMFWFYGHYLRIYIIWLNLWILFWDFYGFILLNCILNWYKKKVMAISYTYVLNNFFRFFINNFSSLQPQHKTQYHFIL